MDCSPPGSSVHGILQVRILEWVAMPSSRGSSQPRDWTCISSIGRHVSLPLAPPGKPAYKEVIKVKWGHRGYNTEWSRSEREKQIPFNITYMWSLEKWCRWTYLQNSNRRTFLVVQWLRIHLPLQGMCVWSPVREPRSHVPGDIWALVPQLERSWCA